MPNYFYRFFLVMLNSLLFLDQIERFNVIILFTLIIDNNDIFQ